MISISYFSSWIQQQNKHINPGADLLYSCFFFLLGSQAYRVLTFSHLIGLLSLEFFFSSLAVQPQAL